MKYEYRPERICARLIYVDVENGVVKDASIEGGCDGNHKGLCALVKGLSYEQLKERLSGINCGGRGTSCPDQLVKAVEAAMKMECHE